MFTFNVDSPEEIDLCILWTRGISEEIETKDLSEYSDKALGWMGSLSRLQALSRSKLLSVENLMIRRSTLLIHKNISAMAELKYRAIDMLCSVDPEYCSLLELKRHLIELQSLAYGLWNVLEFAVRTTHKLLDVQRRETYTP